MCFISTRNGFLPDNLINVDPEDYVDMMNEEGGDAEG